MGLGVQGLGFRDLWLIMALGIQGSRFRDLGI